MLTDKGNSELIENLSMAISVDKDTVGAFVQKLIIFTHGIVSLFTAGVIDVDRKSALLMLSRFAIEQLQLLGVDADMSYLFEVDEL